MVWLKNKNTSESSLSDAWVEWKRSVRVVCDSACLDGFCD